MDSTTWLAFSSQSRRRIASAAGLLLGVAALGSSMLTPATPRVAEAFACSATAAAALPYVLNFNATDPAGNAGTACVLDKDDEVTGFYGVQDNSGLVGNPPAQVDEYNPQLIDRDNTEGILTLTSSAAISGTQAFGSNFANDNTQVNALEVAFDSRAPGGTTTKVISITARIRGSLEYLDVPQEQAGIFFGPDEDNFIKLVVGNKPAGLSIEFIDEQKQGATGFKRELIGNNTAIVNINPVSNTLNTLDLTLVADQEAGKVSAYYAIDGGELMRLPQDVTLPGSGAGDLPTDPNKKNLFFRFVNAPLDPLLPTSKAGILVLHKNTSGTPVSVPFDSFAIIDAGRPGANAGDDLSRVPNTSVQLNGSASAAPIGRTIASYGWKLVDANPPGLNTGITRTGATPSFTAPNSNGVLTFTLVVTDSTGVASSPDFVRVNLGDTPISGLEITPTVPTRLGNVTTLGASIITGTNVRYDWNLGDGTVLPDAGPTVTHTYGAAGSYTAIVSATNNQNPNTPVTASTLIEITNAAPTANAGVTQTVSVGQQVMLNGSGSTDSDGHLPLSYFWRQIGAPAVTLSDPTVVSPTFTAPLTSTQLTFQLVVTDSEGLASAPATVRVNVGDTAVNDVQATSSSPTELGATTFFTGTATGSNLTYSWNFGDGSPAKTGITTTHVYTRPGTFPVTLTVSNASGSRSANITVDVTDNNQAPTANAGPDQTVVTGDQVTLSGSGSDPDGNLPLSYSWRQITGTPVTLSSPNTAVTTFTAPTTNGTLFFELSVTDAKGKKSTDIVAITVNASAPTLRFVYLPAMLK